MFKNHQFPLKIFLLWQSTYLFFQLFIQQKIYLSTESQSLYQRLFLSWTTYWDAGHYVNIAQNGYVYPLQNFFPLWPLFIKIFSFQLIPIYTSSFILTILLAALNFILFYKLAQIYLDEQAARFALILFVTFPSTLFLHAGYTENLFLTLSLSSFLLLERDRPLLSALIGGLASAVRLVGLALPLSFIFIHQPLRKRLLMLFLGLSGLLLYMLFLYLSTHNPIYFSLAQKEWCKGGRICDLSNPLIIMKNSFAHLAYFNTILTYGYDTNTLDWIISLIFIVLGLFSFKYLKLNYPIYSLALVLIPLATGSTISMTRYVLLAFPLFFVMVKIIKDPFIIIFVAICFALMQLLAIVDFTNRLWVA
jgi:Gpi18-like mannosyltransferase